MAIDLRNVTKPQRIFAGLEPDEAEIKAKIQEREAQERERKAEEKRQRDEKLKEGAARAAKPYVHKTHSTAVPDWWTARQVSQAPSSTGTFVGTDDSGKQYSIPYSARRTHVYVSGKTQHGKSTLIRTMVEQEMGSGDGLCVIDAKGDLIPKLLSSVPASRQNDCVFLNLTTPIPIDFMECKNDDEVMNFVSDIVQIFNRLDDGLGVRMDAILRFIVMSLHLTDGATFFDIYNALTDEKYRQFLRDHPAIRSNPYLKRFWTEQAEKLIKGESGTAIAISRMTRFILSPAFQVIFGTPHPRFNFADAIEQKKIILVQLKPNSDEGMLFGSLIVSKIQQAIFRRNTKTVHFSLYVDEFQNFKSSGFEGILSMAGGLGLYLTLANQYFSQLETGLQDAIVNNVSTYFLFRMGMDNASRLKGELITPTVRLDFTDVREAIADNNEALRWWQQRRDNDDEIDRDTYIFASERIREFEEANRYNEALIEEAKRPLPTFLEMLPTLPVGQCIYRAADGSTQKINTPAPHSTSNDSLAREIRQNTIAQYGLKRTVDNSPCNSATVPHNEGNDDVPQPGAAPTHN